MRHLGAPLAGTLSTLLAPLWLLPFPFPFYAANVYTLNNFLLVVNKPSSVLLALRLRLLLLSFSPSSTLQRLISHVVVVLVLVLVVVAGVLRFLFRYAYTAVFDLCLYVCVWVPLRWQNVLTCGSLEFPLPCPLFLSLGCLCLYSFNLCCLFLLLFPPHALLLFQSIDAF